MSVVQVTKISRMKDQWYVFIPKAIQQKLQDMGIQQGSLVLWKEVKEEGNTVRIVIEIVRTNEPVSTRKVAKA